jgi:hypothetical protein
MIPPNLVTAFWEKADGQGYRSTVLRPLGWLLALCAAAAISSASVPSSPGWLTILFGVGTGFSVAIYLGAYVYCLIRNPEYLRTEKYSIQKLAIEKGFRGDSSMGVITVEGVSQPLLGDAENQTGSERD